jgi:hypothetical protein
MKKILLLLLAVLSLCSCKKTPETLSVPFEKVEHYFCVYDGPMSRKIMDQNTFDSMFEAAFTMDTQQEPLDFGKEFVIVIVNPVTDEKTTLTPVSLVKNNDGLVFTYSEQIGEKLTSLSKPCLIIRVDKQYDAPLQIVKVQK